MPFAAIVQRIRSFSLSIGQLTFGGFLLVLAVITATSMASVIAIRHIDATFGELQRLQDVGDLAEEIDRRVAELRLAARDFVTDPNAQSDRVSEAVAALSALLKKTRLELAPEQQDMIDGVAQRFANYREGIDHVTALIARRAELVAALSPVRERFESAIAEEPDRLRRQKPVSGPEPDLRGAAGARSRCLPSSPRSGCGRLAIDTSGASFRNRRLCRCDQFDFGNRGRDCQARQGRARHRRPPDRTGDRTVARRQRPQGPRAGRRFRPGRCATTNGKASSSASPASWPGLPRRCSWCAEPSGRSSRSPKSIRALAGGEKHTSIPATDVDNEIGDIARAAEVFRRSLVDADAAREAAIRALAEQRLAEESYRKLFEGSVDGIYVTTPAGALLNANPALARMMGYGTPEELIGAVSDISNTIYVHPEARAAISRVDGARRHGARI